MEKESSEAALKLTIKKHEELLNMQVADLERSEMSLKQKVDDLECSLSINPKEMLDHFWQMHFWRKRLEIEGHFRCMCYHRYCIKKLVNLLPVKDDDFDPNEVQSELFDDTVSLYLDVLKADTLVSHPFDKENEGDEDEAPSVDPAARY